MRFSLGVTLACALAALSTLVVMQPTELEAQSAFEAGRVTVATTATAVFTTPRRGGTVLLCNRHTESVYLGPSSVTTANGFELIAGDCTSQTPYPRTVIYAVVAAATARVDYTVGSYPR